MYGMHDKDMMPAVLKTFDNASLRDVIVQLNYLVDYSAFRIYMYIMIFVRLICVAEMLL